MKIANRKAGIHAAGLLAVTLCGSAGAAVIAPELEAELAARAPADEVAVIVTLSDKVNHRLFERRDRRERDGRLTRELKGKASVHEIREKLAHLLHDARRQLHGGEK